MRPLEITLIITIVLCLLAVGRQRRFGRIGAAVLVALLILHWVVEHGRWQLYPAYLAAFITVALLIRNKPLKRLPKIAVPILALIGLGLGALFPILTIPAVTGAYQVGTYSEAITYDGRPLMVQVWYPAVIDDDKNEPRAEYIPNLEQLAGGIVDDFGLPAFLVNHLNLIEPNAYERPEIAPPVSDKNDDLFPVILFSHGLGGVRMQNTLQAEELASHGYVVVATDHHPFAISTVFPDGTTIPYDKTLIRWDTPNEEADYTEMVELWTADLVALADQLEMWQWRPSHLLYASIDMENIGVFGHSTGGGTAYQFCARDERCTAALGLDPWIEPMEDGIMQNGLEKPILAMTTETALGEDNFGELAQFYGANRAAAWWLIIPETTHFDYTDFPCLSVALDWFGISSPAYKPHEMTALINDYTRSFFDYHLVDGTGALLYVPSEAYPNVVIERR